MPLNFSLGPKAYPVRQVDVSPAEIAAYAAASSDPNPRFQPGPNQVAPPLFAVRPGFFAVGTVTGDPELGVENPLLILHGEQEFRYHTPLRPGPIELAPFLERVEDKGSGATFVVRVEARANGQPVVDQWWTIFVRGGGSGAPRPKSERTEPVATSEIAHFDTKIELDMPIRYAEASGDHNPIHLDPEVAKLVGLPGVINHGLGTLAAVSGGLVDHLVGGDPGRLVRFQARFTAPVTPGEVLSTLASATDRPGLALYAVTRPDGVSAIVGQLEYV